MVCNLVNIRVVLALVPEIFFFLNIIIAFYRRNSCCSESSGAEFFVLYFFWHIWAKKKKIVARTFRTSATWKIRYLASPSLFYSIHVCTRSSLFSVLLALALVLVSSCNIATFRSLAPIPNYQQLLFFSSLLPPMRCKRAEHTSRIFHLKKFLCKFLPFDQSDKLFSFETRTINYTFSITRTLLLFVRYPLSLFRKLSSPAGRRIRVVLEMVKQVC